MDDPTIKTILRNTFHSKKTYLCRDKYEQAGAELGKDQLKLELGFTLIKVCCIMFLAAMNSSRSDDVTKSVVCVFVVLFFSLQHSMHKNEQ